MWLSLLRKPPDISHCLQHKCICRPPLSLPWFFPTLSPRTYLPLAGWTTFCCPCPSVLQPLPGMLPLVSQRLSVFPEWRDGAQPPEATPSPGKLPLPPYHSQANLSLSLPPDSPSIYGPFCISPIYGIYNPDALQLARAFP